GFDCSAQQRRGVAITAEESLQRFAVREIKPAASGEQKLASERGHLVIDDDGHTGARQYLRRHQAGRTAADHGGALVAENERGQSMAAFRLAYFKNTLIPMVTIPIRLSPATRPAATGKV